MYLYVHTFCIREAKAPASMCDKIMCDNSMRQITFLNMTGNINKTVELVMYDKIYIPF